MVGPILEGALVRADGDERKDAWGAALSLAALVGAVYSLGLASAGFFDNEGRYAEMAREMRLRGDWVTPHLNGVPLLTKPPLTQWLTAAAYGIVGTNEWARLVTVLASMATLVGTCLLGARLLGRTTGLLGGLALATMLGFVLEARTLRPDALLVATVTWAILCWHVAETGSARRRTAALLAFYAALGIGMLAKGFVPFVVAGPPIALWMFRRHGWSAVARMRPLLGIAVLAAVVLPWHVAAAIENPGFAWDYVVNQHLLFAVDKKEPRDSTGDVLWFFWAALAFRSAPWGLVAPLTLGRVAQEVGGTKDAPTLFLWTWALGHVVVFSLTPSRLEHYSLPAHPALALLAAAGLRTLAAGAGRSAWAWMAMLTGAVGAAGLVLALTGPGLVSQAYWIPQVPRLLGLVPWAAAVLIAGGVAMAVGIARRAPAQLGGALLVTAALMSAITARALTIATPLFSWKPVAEVLARDAAGAAEIVFEAPVEYQLVGGLDFYLGRVVTLLEPPGGFVPPTYLEGRMAGMFMSRDDFARRWQGERPVFLVSDPEKRRDTADGIAPGPAETAARFGDRWVLTNAAAAR